MRRYLRLYGAFLAQQFRTFLQYRVNFLIGAVSTISMQAAGILTIWVVMRQVPVLNGWSYRQVLLVYGLLVLSKSFGHMFADNLWTLGRVYIIQGTFDRFLVRPINPLFHLLADRFCQDGAGDFLVGLVLVVTSSSTLHIVWTPGKFLYLILSIITGAAIFVALNLITCVSAFWFGDSVPFTRMLFDTNEFAQYPLSIYNRVIRTLMTWVIPYGFCSFYPASALRGDDIGALVWVGPIFASGLLIFGYYVWTIGLRHYSSTGS